MTKRRKSDGYTKTTYRCAEHRGLVNDHWEVDRGFDVTVWAEHRLEAFVRAPEMYGSNDALEAMGLVVVEVEHKSMLGTSREGTRDHLEAYTRAMAGRYGSGVLPLTERLPLATSKEFAVVLVSILTEVRVELARGRRP